jgi:predicted HicB family RNase H-like nuclease
MRTPIGFGCRDIAIQDQKRASRPAPEPEPPKRRAKRQRYAGEDMAILTVRIPERERALCYADATETIRTINAHVIHRLKHLVAKKGGVVRGQDVHSFIEAHGQGLGQRFVIRLPVSLQEEVKALAERPDASVNALIRYALFQYPAPPSDMLPYRVRVYRGPSPLPTQRESNEGSEAQHIQWHAH